MANLKDGSQQLSEFVTSDNVFFDTPSKKYQIYAPKKYDSEKSLFYFRDENSIMSHSLGKGNVALDIDDAVVDILRTIGWDFPESDFLFNVQIYQLTELAHHTLHTHSLWQKRTNQCPVIIGNFC